MILGTEQAAAIRRRADLTIYMAKLDEAKRRAVDLGLTDDVVRINEMIHSAVTQALDTQAIVDLYERQESARDVARALRDATRRGAEQLLLHPEAQVL